MTPVKSVGTYLFLEVTNIRGFIKQQMGMMKVLFVGLLDY
jgi:hypothetical protein